MSIHFSIGSLLFPRPIERQGVLAVSVVNSSLTICPPPPPPPPFSSFTTTLCTSLDLKWSQIILHRPFQWPVGYSLMTYGLFQFTAFQVVRFFPPPLLTSIVLYLCWFKIKTRHFDGQIYSNQSVSVFVIIAIPFLRNLVRRHAEL